MSYDARERSADQGEPIELFEFGRDYQRWRYTSADREVTADSLVYRPAAISRSAIEISVDKPRNAITITAPRDLEVAELYRIQPPTTAVSVILREYHRGDDDVATIWSGRIVTVAWIGPACEISCEPISSGMRRLGLRRLYQRQCPHVLYDSACTVNREAVRVDGIIDSISGDAITVPEADVLADGWFAGGYLEFDVALGIAERRFITDHTGPVLTISGASYGMAVGSSVRLYPGCDHTIATCQGKFSNAANYGGFPYFATKNPFGSDPIF